MNAAGIVALLDFLARNLPGYRITAQNAEQAADLIEAHFGEWAANVPVSPFSPDAEIFNERKDIDDQIDVPPDIGLHRFKRADGAVETRLDGMTFVTCCQGRKIHHLNDGAVRTWNLLAEPATLSEATMLLCSAFQDTPSDQIAADTRRIFETPFDVQPVIVVRLLRPQVFLHRLRLSVVVDHVACPPGELIDVLPNASVYPRK